MRMRDAVPPVEILIIRATFCGIFMQTHTAAAFTLHSMDLGQTKFDSDQL